MKKYLTVLLIIPSILFSQDNVSNEDLSKKLDLILQKIGGLEERVSKLESENTEVKREVEKVAKSAREAKTATEKLVLPGNEQERKSFFNKLRIGLESDADKNKGAWTQEDTWQSMKKNLTQFQVRKILGNPNMIKGDLSPRIDQVYHYKGDLDGDGKDENARVNFYQGQSRFLHLSVLRTFSRQSWVSFTDLTFLENYS